VLRRLHRWATLVWLALACGAGVGFLARDLLVLPQPLVAFAWLAGALLGILPAAAAAAWRDEGGQATVEWTGLVLLASLALGALATFGPHVDGRSFGGFLTHRIVCAVKGGCRDGDGALARAYGVRDAALVRAHAPNIVYEPGERQVPVDWRRCRRAECAEAPDERDLDVHRSDAGERATVFTRVLRRAGRTYLQYWLYYPDSNTTWAGSDKAWEAAWLVPRVLGVVNDAPAYPGYHRDDWEGYVVRLDPDGSAWVRAGSHGHWQGCKQRDCRGEWVSRTGWTRVSRGSHAGHIPLRTEERAGRRRHVPLLPGHDLDERTTTGEGLRLIPLETHDRRGYRPNAEGIQPPWKKEAYRDPTSDRS
jgi:hypothetical protein